MQYIDWIVSTSVFLLVFVLAITQIPQIITVNNDTQTTIATEDFFDYIVTNTDVYTVYYENNNYEPLPFIFKSDIDDVFEDDDFAKKYSDYVYGVGSEELHIYDKEIVRNKILFFEEPFESNKYQDDFVYSVDPKVEQIQNILEMDVDSWIYLDKDLLWYDAEISFDAPTIDLFFSYVDNNNYIKTTITETTIEAEVKEGGVVENTETWATTYDDWRTVGLKVDENHLYFNFDNNTQQIENTYSQEGKIKIVATTSNTQINNIKLYKHADLYKGATSHVSEHFIITTSTSKITAEINKLGKTIEYDFEAGYSLSTDNTYQPIYFIKNVGDVSAVLFPSTTEFWTYTPSDENMSLVVSGFSVDIDSNGVFLDDGSNNTISLLFYNNNQEKKNDCSVAYDEPTNTLTIYDCTEDLRIKTKIHYDEDIDTTKNKEMPTYTVTKDKRKFVYYEDLDNISTYFTESLEELPFYIQINNNHFTKEYGTKKPTSKSYKRFVEFLTEDGIKEKAEMVLELYRYS